MNPDDLTRILDELGERLGPTGSHVFDLAVRQVYVDAITAVILLVVTIAVGLFFGPRLFRWQKDGNSSSDRDLVAVVAVFGYVVLATFTAFVVLICIPAVLNPEYAAIKDILGAITP